MASLSLLFSRPNISQEPSKVSSSSSNSNSNSQQIWRENHSIANSNTDNLNNNNTTINIHNNNGHILNTNVNENVLKQGGVRAIQASQIVHGIPNNTSVRQPTSSSNQLPSSRVGELLGGEREVVIDREYEHYPTTYGRRPHPLSLPLGPASVISPYTSNYTSSSSSSSSSSFATSPTAASIRKHHPLHRYQVQSSVEALNHQSCMALQSEYQSTVEHENQSPIHFLPESFLPWVNMDEVENVSAADFDAVTIGNNVGFPHYDHGNEIGNGVGKDMKSNQSNSYHGALMNIQKDSSNNKNNIDNNNNNNSMNNNNNNNNNNINNNNNMYNNVTNVNGAMLSKTLHRIVGSRNVPPQQGQGMFPAHEQQVDQGYNILNKVHPQHLSNKFMIDDVRNGNSIFRPSIDSIGSKEYDIYGLSQNHSLSDLPGIVGLGSRSLGSGMGGLGSMSCLGIGSEVDGIEETFRDDMSSLRREGIIDKNHSMLATTTNHVVGLGIGTGMNFSSNPSNIYNNRFGVVVGGDGFQFQGPGRNDRIFTDSRGSSMGVSDDRSRNDIEIIKSELEKETIGMLCVRDSSSLVSDRNITTSTKHVTVEGIYDIDLDTDIDADADAVVNGVSDSITSSIAAYWHSETLPLPPTDIDTDIDTVFHSPFINPDLTSLSALPGLSNLSQPHPLSGVDLRTEHAVLTHTIDHVQCQVQQARTNESDVPFSGLCNDEVIDIDIDIDIAMDASEGEKGVGGGREKKLRGESMDLGFDEFMDEYGNSRNFQNSEVRSRDFNF